MFWAEGIFFFASFWYTILISVSAVCGCKPWELRTTLHQKDD